MHTITPSALSVHRDDFSGSVEAISLSKTLFLMCRSDKPIYGFILLFPFFLSVPRPWTKILRVPLVLNRELPIHY
jgi:hypothetical protein